jgi:superfamily II DNA/RNA helicase
MSRTTRGRSPAVSSSTAPSPVGAEQNSIASAGHETSERRTFELLGLHPPIVASLREAFPDVKYPTEVQAKFIPAVLAGKDVLLKDATGSGKCVTVSSLLRIQSQ